MGNGRPVSGAQRLAVLQADLDRLQLYLDQIHLAPGPRPGSDEAAREALLHLLHGLDHLQRLHERCEEEQDRLRTAATSSSLASEHKKLLAALEQLPVLVQQGSWAKASALVRACAQALQRRDGPYRQEVLAAAGEPAPRWIRVALAARAGFRRHGRAPVRRRCLPHH